VNLVGETTLTERGAGYEDAIRERFRHLTWPQASEAFFGVLDQELR
jgi:hypothetical protein